MLTKQDIFALKNQLKALPRLADKDRDARIKKASNDFEFAVQTYFPHHIDNCKKETSKFRKFCYKELPSLLEKERKITGEAYRGAAKTTMISRLLLLWLTAIKATKRHAAIISSTLDVAIESLDVIKTELEDNENLISDFNIITGERLGESWSSDEIIFSTNGVLIRAKAYGAGKKIRGANWRSHRPDVVVCDDIENDENVETKAQRDKLYKWFIKAIMKLPSRKSETYNIIYIGTKLHHDSCLSRIQARADFYSFSYPLVLKFPTEIDSLDKRNLKKSDAKGMELDDSSLNAFELLKEYLEDKDSFMSEFQNQPLSRDNLTFAGYVTTKESFVCDSYAIGIDPSLGKTSGDYFSISILGFLASVKKYYLTNKSYKIKPTMMIPKILQIYLDIAKLGKPIKIAVEEVQFQEFFKDVLVAEAKKLGITLPIVPLRNTVPKELRIDSISPFINNGDWIIDENSHTLIEELDSYPKAPHDDALDASEMAWRILKKPSFDYKQAGMALAKIAKRNELLKRLKNGH